MSLQTLRSGILVGICTDPASMKLLQALYGPKSSKNDNKNNDVDDSDSGVESNVIDTGDPKEKNELCETNTRLDAIVTTKDTNTYVFKGNKVVCYMRFCSEILP